MPHPLHVPRVNNNDDQVTIVELSVKDGDFVRKGQIVGAVETDKAVLEVEADRDGYVLKVVPPLKAQATVGSVLLWLGDSADDAVPVEGGGATAAGAAGTRGRPTAAARARLKELGLDAERIPADGERLTEKDIEAWLATQARAGAATRSDAPSPERRERTPDVAGELQDLSPEEHGMMATVLWHRDQAAAGYIETEYDPAPWEAYAKHYADGNRLLMPPLMPLMAYRLVELATASPRINCAIVGQRRYRYGPVNLGFTVQSGAMLYLTVIRDAGRLDTKGFIEAMGDVQRRAMTHKLLPSEMSGATIAFTSMARWNVSRHVPILPPQTGLIVAHSAPRGTGKAVLGASYDHRLLSGFDVVQVLQALAQPPAPPKGEVA
jgi:pyruvate/2-oxoglutarate dehydrogenase complex dihydrolipoamide acyltransferase (E2) component